jgi:alpha-N-acetylglucosaminidase
LDGAPDDRLIVLDLWAEVEPYWRDHSNFYGKQFIWCMLHNFGGRSGLYAAFDAVNNGVALAMKEAASNLVGIGLTPEAIDTNPIIYDFMMEFAWTSAPRDVDAWVAGWATRRYGVANAAAASYWHVLRQQILNCSTGQMSATATPIVMPPRLYNGVGCCAPTQQYYDPSKLDAAWTTLLSAAAQLASRDTYKNDLVEITRQVLGDHSFVLFNKLVAAFNASDADAFNSASVQFLALFEDLDQMLGSQPSYLLGVWAQRASMWGVTPEESAELRRSALLQVSVFPVCSSF